MARHQVEAPSLVPRTIKHPAKVSHLRGNCKQVRGETEAWQKRAGDVKGEGGGTGTVQERRGKHKEEEVAMEVTYLACRRRTNLRMEKTAALVPVTRRNPA